MNTLIQPRPRLPFQTLSHLLPLDLGEVPLATIEALYRDQPHHQLVPPSRIRLRLE